MQIDDSFRVKVPLEDAWRILIDLGRIAPSIPGAQLQGIEGDEHHGVVNVKVGPITAQYQGTAKLESVDAATHTAILVATSHDSGGEGDAAATIKFTLIPDGDGTRVDVDADVSITGKVAQFGRDVLADVSTKLLAQFAQNLERDVLGDEVVDLTEPEGGAHEAVADEELEDDEGADELVAEAVAARAEPAAEPSGNGAAVRKADPGTIRPEELLEIESPPLLRRVAPLAGFVLIAVVLRWLVRRRNR